MTLFPKSSGIHTLFLEGKEQRVSLLIPNGYTDSAPVPLVLALHWGGQVTPFYSQPFLTDLIAPALQPLSALIVAPDCKHDGWNNPQSEHDLLTLLDLLQTHYAFDPTNIVLTGYSKGGIGTWYLAARHPERLLAAIPMAAPPPEASQLNWPIPLYVIHSRQDEHFPLEPTAVTMQTLQAQGNDVTFVVLDDVTHYDAGGFIQPLRTAVPWLNNLWLARHSQS